MRLLPVLLLVACADIGGNWQIQSLSIDGVEVRDAGFLDVQLGGATGSDTPVATLLRYRWDPLEATFAPDQRPEVRLSSMDTAAYERGDDVGLNLVVPLTGEVEEEVRVTVPRTENRTLTLEGDTPWGPTLWELVR